MKIYTLIGGVNGAGKSSLTGSLRSERSDLGIVVDPDKLTVQCGGDEYEGGKLAVKHIEQALEDGVNFTQETNAQRRPDTIFACTMSVWTLPRKVFGESKTA